MGKGLTRPSLLLSRIRAGTSNASMDHGRGKCMHAQGQIRGLGRGATRARRGCLAMEGAGARSSEARAGGHVRRATSTSAMRVAGTQRCMNRGVEAHGIRRGRLWLIGEVGYRQVGGVR